MSLIRITVFIIGLLVFSQTGFAQSTLPYTQNFDSQDYPVWGGSRHTYLTGSVCYGGSGGCARFYPLTTPGGYSGMGQFPNLPANTRRINIRVLLKVGSTYHTTVRAYDAGTQNKMFIVLKNGDNDRLLTIFEQYGGTFFTWGACPGSNACFYAKNASGGLCDDPWRPCATDPFKSTSYIDQWVCVETEHDLVAGTSKTWIWTQDGVNNGLHVQNTLDNQIGSYSYVQIIGGYFNSYHINDPNNYIIFDNLVISNTFIGPPEGFLGNVPAAPTGLRIVQ